MDAISTALGGMTAATARFDRAAGELVKSTAGVSAASPEAAMVDLIQARTQFRAGAAVFRAADDMMGALLDIRV